MEDAFGRKYKRVLEILPDVAECAGGKLVLAGGTAIALFHLQHRVSVDLDFVPLKGDEVRLAEELKGCLTKKGYRTARGAYRNQFVIQFEDTGIKIEVFEPEIKIRRFEERVFGNVKVLVASLDDLRTMKMAAYGDRREARDLFDIFCMEGKKEGVVKKLVSKAGAPKNLNEVGGMAADPGDFEKFVKAVSDAS